MESDATRKRDGDDGRAVEMVVETRARDLVEGLKVRRALPPARRRIVGPFDFLDRMGTY